MILKNQKLEAKIKDLEHLKKEVGELKQTRDKQQVEFKTLYADKQKLYEDIVALKDQVSQARSDTKEKIMSISFIEKEKSMLEKQLDETKNHLQKSEHESAQNLNQLRSVESKLALAEQQITNLKTQHFEDKDTFTQVMEEAKKLAKTQSDMISQLEKKAMMIE